MSSIYTQRYFLGIRRQKRYDLLVLLLLLLFAFLGPWLPLSAQSKVRSKSASKKADFRVGALKTQQRPSTAQVAVATLHPALSWEVFSNAPAGSAKQEVTAYQVVLGSKSAISEIIDSKPKRELVGTSSSSAPLWNTGKLAKGNLFQTTYKGVSKLQSDQIYYWAVRVWDGSGKASAWSSIDSFQTALLDRRDFGAAKWIGRQQMAAKERVLPGDTPRTEMGAEGKLIKVPFGTDNDTLPLFRKEFKLLGTSSQLQRATLYICGLGQFEARLNGHKIGDHFLDPGWTNFQKQALYVSLDVTGQLKAGNNALGVTLGNGFYYIPGSGQWYKKLLVQYGYPKLICRLSIHYTDGRHQDIVSDASWQTGSSSILFNSIYGGALEDGRLAQEGWDKAGFEKADKLWRPAVLVTDTPAALSYQQIDPIRVMEKFAVKKVYPVLNNESDTVSAKWTYDMGQNCSGIPFIEINGKRGDTITLLPAELITEAHGANQRATGKYKLIYVLQKDGLQSWHPKFTYYGFRYIEVSGAVPKGKPNSGSLPVVENLQTWHIRNSAPAAGSFSCSNALFNKTNALIRWAIKSNMMSLFTDCPHREKLGWLEQVHLMGSSVRYNYQIEHLLKKALGDMRDAQTSSGLIPEIAPEYTVFTWGGDMFRDSPEWGSSAIIIPWYIYQWYGDTTELKKNYDMMCRYMDYLKGKAKGHILYQGLGDWYDLGPNPPGTSQLTPQGLTATAIYYYDLQILAKTAKLLGKDGDARQFLLEGSTVRAAFNQKFLHQEVDSLANQQVFYGSGSQTADAMALFMGLVPDSLHNLVVSHLVNHIKTGNYALTAGDIGYRYLLRVLEQEGYNELIFKMNNRSDVPGYGYQLARGATALTESWQALPSVSNNHFMLGHIMEWFYSGILGIRLNLAAPASGEKADKALVIAPMVVGNLHWAKGDYQTSYGAIRVDWQKSKEAILVKVHLPVGLPAEIRLPYYPGATVLSDDGVQMRLKKVGNNKEFVAMAGSGDHNYKILLKN